MRTAVSAESAHPGVLITKKKAAAGFKNHHMFATAVRTGTNVLLKRRFTGQPLRSSHGNPIDFLTGFLGYGFVDAVTALTDGASCLRPPASPQEEHAAPHPISLPESAEKPYRRVYAYLLGRGIPPGMIRILEQRGLLYQERNHDMESLIPAGKDWNEDLQALRPVSGYPPLRTL
jgi:hypothetical protein